jgi:cobaltochelatase CobS
VSIDDFFGSKELINGNTVISPTEPLRAMQARRPLIIDELDAGTPEVLFCLQGVAAKEPVPLTMNTGDGCERVVLNPWYTEDERPSTFRLCATANTLGRGDTSGLYRGTHVLNSAFLNRWAVLNLDYPPPQEEQKVLVKRFAIHPKTAERIVNVAFMARKAAKEAGDIIAPISVRNTLAWAEYMTMLGLNSREAFCLAVLENALPEDQEFFCETFQRVFGRTVSPDCLHG